MLDQAIRTLKPATVEEVQAAVAEAGAAARHIEVVGGGTKRGIGGMDPVDLVLSTTRLDGIVDYAPDELVLTAQAGVRLADLEALVAAKGLLNPGKVFPTLHRCAELGRMHVHAGRLAFPDIPRF